MKEVNIDGQPKVQATLPEILGEPDATRVARIVANDMDRPLKEVLITLIVFKHFDRVVALHIDPLTFAPCLLDAWEKEQESWKSN